MSALLENSDQDLCTVTVASQAGLRYCCQGKPEVLEVLESI